MILKYELQYSNYMCWNYRGFNLLKKIIHSPFTITQPTFCRCTSLDTHSVMRKTKHNLKNTEYFYKY